MVLLRATVSFFDQYSFGRTVEQTRSVQFYSLLVLLLRNSSRMTEVQAAENSMKGQPCDAAEGRTIYADARHQQAIAASDNRGRRRARHDMYPKQLIVRF